MNECHWNYNNRYGCWATTCKNEWYFDDGDTLNDLLTDGITRVYCPFCGRLISREEGHSNE